MKRLAALLLATISTASAARAADVPAAAVLKAQADDRRWEAAVNFETRYVSWSGTRGFPSDASTARGSGAQFYAPVSVQAVGIPVDVIKIELLAKSGYVWSRQSTAGLTGSVSTMTDTVLSGTVTYGGIPGIQPFVALNVNVPTGQSVLKGSAANARMDPDIVDLGTFGEGWNVGPTIGANIPISDATTWSFGLGRTFRGPYDREGPAANPDALLRIDPGDVTTASVSVATEFDRFAFAASAAYSIESETSRGGAVAFKLGDRILAAAALAYGWSELSKSTIIASWNHYEKNHVLTPPSPDIAVEAFNSNSNVYRVRLDHAFKHGDWGFGPMVRFMRRDANSYSPTTLQFVPAKTLWGTGATITHSVNKQTDLKANVEHIWVDEHENPGSSVPARSINGWAFMVGAVISR